MKAYNTLTSQGRLRRLHQLANIALAEYDVRPTAVSLMNKATNLIYQVKTEDGQTLILRLARPNWRTRQDLQSGAMWMEALAKETDIPVANIILSKRGEYVVTAVSPHIPDPRNFLLMTRLPGILLGKRLTQANLFRMGNLFAKLHQHGKQWQTPTDFTTRQFTNFISRDEPDLFLSEKHQEAYTPNSLTLIHEVRALVEAEYQQLDHNDLRVIHCDLWHNNIKIQKGNILAPFDFEDTIWGFRLHDIAMAMLDLAMDVTQDHYIDLLVAFRDGYSQTMPWPAGNMLMLQLGRMLWKLNYTATHAPQWLPQAISFHANLFERYLAQRKLTESLKPN